MIEIDKAVADSDTAQRALLFIENAVPPGIEPEDPMINIRSRPTPSLLRAVTPQPRSKSRRAQGGGVMWTSLSRALVLAAGLLAIFAILAGAKSEAGQEGGEAKAGREREAV